MITMKTFQIKVLAQKDEALVENLLKDLARKGSIEFLENAPDSEDEKLHPATENQVQEIIDESEIGPYYSEKEAKDILNL